MRRISLAILTVLMALFPHPGTAQPAPLTPDCRYLFLIDTSLSMTRLQESIATSVSRLIATGLDGQMTPGEVFTIWTFNEDVQQHEFPLTSWSPERGDAMSLRVDEFLRSRRFRRNSNMRALINSVYEAKRACPRLAVFLISNGEEVVVGTPFDRNINVSYGRRFEELRASWTPFLTTLMCQNGEIVAWSAVAANETIDLPGGPDGQPVVGRRRQPITSNPAPIPSEVRTGTLGPVTNALSMVVPEAPAPAMPPKTTTLKPATESAPPPPAPEKPVRKVVNLSPPVDPDAPRVVAPTDVAPQPKVELPKLPFTKPDIAIITNATPVAIAPLAATANPEAPPAAMDSPVADPPVEISEAKPAPIAKVTPPIGEPTRPVVAPSPAPALPKSSPDIVLAASTPAPASASSVTTNSVTPPVTRVVIVTQVVNVAWPQRPVPKPKPQIVTPPPPAKNPPEPTPTVVITNTPAIPPGAPTPKRPSFVAGPASKFAASTTNPPTVVPRAPAPPAENILATANKGFPKHWIYLVVAIGLLIMAGLSGRKLMNPPLDASLISQSMEDRDNG